AAAWPQRPRDGRRDAGIGGNRRSSCSAARASAGFAIRRDCDTVKSVPPSSDRSATTRVPTIILHGGAGADPGEGRDELRRGMRAAALAGWRVLSAGGAALDAVEAAVRVLEGDPGFNAGRGSVLTRDGAVALDRSGTIAAATSTGGTAGKAPGRVGDSALIGCGTYAESSVGGVSCTGDGEAIIRVVLGHRTLAYLKDAGDPEYAAKVAV